MKSNKVYISSRGSFAREKILTFFVFFFSVYSFILKSFIDFGFLDEIAIMFFLIALLSQFKLEIKLNRKFLLFLFLLFTSILIGLISSLIHHYQDFPNSLKGASIYFKTLIPSLTVIIFSLNGKTLDQGLFFRSLKKHFLASLMFLSVLNFWQIISVPTNEYIIGIPRLYASLEPKASYGIITMFLGVVFYSVYRKETVPFGILIIYTLLLFFSFRVKAVIFLSIILLFLFGSKKFLSLRTILSFAGVTSILLSIKGVRELVLNKIILNLGFSGETDSIARFELHNRSIDVATDHFPLGAGFSTFGSSFSQNPYSPLYDQYGLSNVYGLSERYPVYISDTQLAPIIAELGYFGAIIYLFGLGYFIHGLLTSENSNKKGITLAIIFMLISITSTQALFNSTFAGLILLITCLATVSNKSVTKNQLSS